MLCTTKARAGKMSNMNCFSILTLIFFAGNAIADVSTPHYCEESGKCFTVLVDVRFNWNDAEKYCEQLLPNGRLASIHNAFEGSIISSWLPFLSTDPWIGAFQIGSLPFQWSDNSALEYTNWAPGQPTSPCAQICHSSATNAGVTCQQGKWRTADCENISAQIICEYGNISSSTPTAPPTVVERSCSVIGKCFALVSGSLRWSEAESFCESQTQNGITATLASITSQADANIIGEYTAADCVDLHNSHVDFPSGVYLLASPGVSPFNVFCDMDTEGGGWTVFQKRSDGELSFYDKTWNEYKNGFNDGLDHNFWLGNDFIHLLSTKDSNVEIRIDVWGDRTPGSPYPNGHWYEKRTNFFIDNEANFYILHISNSSSGNSSISGANGFFYNNGMKFSTIDVDHGQAPSPGCSVDGQLGGWWLDYCSYVALNGKYIPSPTIGNYVFGFQWYINGANFTNPAQSRMMLRKIK